jgi:SAM-dependent methyltransferase
MNLWRYLDNPVLWEVSRIGIDLAFGLYRKRMRLMQTWGILEGRPSVLDIGCGIGQYATITDGDYLGVDLNERYIDYARRRHRRPNQSFQCMDVTALCEDKRVFHLVQMVDFLHHISDEQCVAVLTAASQLAQRYVVSFEPITHQLNSLGRWIVKNDRGEYMRSLEQLYGLFEASHLPIVRSIPLRLGPISTRALLCRPEKAGHYSSYEISLA